MISFFKYKKNLHQTQFEKELKYHEIKRNALKKENKKKLSKLEKSEFILDYTHSFSSDYMLYDGLTDWIKNMNFKERMWFVINSCNSINPTKQEQFLLALAYCNLGTLYNNYAIYYIELYLKDHDFYDKKFRSCNNRNDKINYQWVLFNYKLACKYKEDLNYNKALKYAFMAKGMNDSFSKPFDVYDLISDILYKMGDLENAIANLNEGIRKVSNKYEKERLVKLLNTYQDYKSKGKLYKQKNVKRLRIDMTTNLIYDLTTGEIIENNDD